MQYVNNFIDYTTPYIRENQHERFNYLIICSTSEQSEFLGNNTLFTQNYDRNIPNLALVFIKVSVLGPSTLAVKSPLNSETMFRLLRRVLGTNRLGTKFAIADFYFAQPENYSQDVEMKI